jgi:hypothetical protein
VRGGAVLLGVNGLQRPRHIRDLVIRHQREHVTILGTTE